MRYLNVSVRRVRAILTVLAMAALVFFLHPQASDDLALPVIAILIIFSLILIAREVSGLEDLRFLAGALAPIGALTLLALVTSILRIPSLSTLREVFLVFVVFILGFSVSRVGGQRLTLLGILGGSVAVSALGWFLRLDQANLTTFAPFSESSDFLGLSGNQGYEFFGALMGVVAGITLLGARHWSRPLIALGTGFSMLTLVWTGSIVGWISVAALLVAVAVLLLARTKWAKWALRVSAGFVISAFVSIATLVAFPAVAVALADFVGKSTSLEARMVSWGFALQNMDLTGWIFGYGLSFWKQDTVSRDGVTALLAPYGHGPFSHSHSIYVDLIVSFGVVGVALIGLLVWAMLRNSSVLAGAPGSWQGSAGPWLFLVGLAASGLAESILVFRPSGWLLAGLLYGAFAAGNSIFGRGLESSWPDGGGDYVPVESDSQGAHPPSDRRSQRARAQK